MTTSRIIRAQNVSHMCVVCGLDNPFGLSGRFFELESGELLGEFRPKEHHQGYPGRLHGGIASTMLDEAIGRAINICDHDAWGVTVELEVRFLAPVPLAGPTRVIARIEKDSSRLFTGTGEIVLDDGSVAVRARGKYLKLPIDRIAEGDFSDQWVADERPLPPAACATTSIPADER